MRNQGRFHRLTTSDGRLSSINNFCTLGSIQKPINTLTKKIIGQTLSQTNARLPKTWKENKVSLIVTEFAPPTKEPCFNHSQTRFYSQTHVWNQFRNGIVACISSSIHVTPVSLCLLAAVVCFRTRSSNKGILTHNKKMNQVVIYDLFFYK